MTILNNRDKIQSEVASQKYKDNWDRIFGKKPSKTFNPEQVVEQDIEETTEKDSLDLSGVSYDTYCMGFYVTKEALEDFEDQDLENNIEKTPKVSGESG